MTFDISMKLGQQCLMDNNTCGAAKNPNQSGCRVIGFILLARGAMIVTNCDRLFGKFRDNSTLSLEL
ncbi:unnamed protein product [Linum tenue]|uniref:Uncharacterized protein n=1 Tax=Linum tenue TaxID=586396 RepID=A0AAV0JWW3_9ROSI|nr:unnamed protein product [Linum tenue]CAI0414048.1 unnamed protein product [Linum tenue]CAI0468734.1 unnamed protein product [Linum tenue]CAI0543672.1 unnamed protein product [Linum tenue]